MTDPTPPPRWAKWVLHRFCTPARLEDIEGDLAEQFHSQRQRHGALRAYLIYWIDVLRFAATPHVRRSQRLAYDHARGPVMLKNYLKIAFRTLNRHKGYTFINVMGLAVGIACCLLILLYVQDERSYDRFHEHADRIVRVIGEVESNDGSWRGRAATPYLLMPLIRDEFPQVEQAVRLAQTSQLVRYDNQQFTEENFFFADSTVFEVFSFDFIQGDPATALQQPFSVVLTVSTAHKYFGAADPLGQTLTVDNERTFTVTGVVQDMPDNAHFHFDFLAALSSTRSWYSENMFTEWGSIWNYTYLLLEENTTSDNLSAQLDAFMARHLPPEIPFAVRLQLQPLTDIHLHSHLFAEIEPNSDISYLYIFSLVAVFILLIACINFMNLATARAAGRAREVGVRKMMGAYRGQLIRQFLSESVLMSLGATALGLALAALALPMLNAVAGKTLSLSVFSNPLLAAALLGIGLLVGVLSGSYPAFFLSRFQPARVLKGQMSKQGSQGAAWLRKSLVVFQFGISIVLIVSTVIVYRQLQFAQTKNLGFDRAQTVEIYLKDGDLRDRYEALKSTFAQTAGVTHIAAASNAPPDGLNSWRVRPQSAPPEEADLMSLMAVDYDYLETLGLHLAAGRAFSEDFPSDAEGAILINEAAAQKWGLDDPVGERFRLESADLTAPVIGVVEDFHMASLHEEIEPVFLIIWPDWYNRLLIKIEPGQVAETMDALERQWKTFAPDWPFEYAFLDDRFDALYRAEQRLGTLFSYFAGLAIFIACLGLFGLAAFSAEQRTKEIGIRKVLGATVPQILVLLTREFVLLVLVAFVVATPLSYLAMQRWLEDFAYRTDLGMGIFILAGGLALLIALLTVSYQSLKAAVADPATSLRHE